MNTLPFILEQFDATRRYLRIVLPQVPIERWCEMLGGSPSHVMWQVGHIGVSQAGLCWRTVCGRELSELVPAGYVELFGKGSQPSGDAARYPQPAVITQFVEDVQVRVVEALRELDEAVLAEPASHATGLIHTKADLLMWAVRHEMLHIGQIGLIRRLFGVGPYR